MSHRLRSRLPLALALAALGLSVARADPGDGAGAPARPGPPRLAQRMEPEPDAPGSTPEVEHPQALAAFFAALARTAARQGITRVAHFGDSSIGMDGLPHALRLRFQRAFGDAGPGFVFLAPDSDSYINRTVRLRYHRPWDACVIIRGCRRDDHYGLGGVTVESARGAQTSMQPVPGRRVSRAELWYAATPGGGRVRFELGDRAEEIDTASDALEDRWHTIRREAGEHEVRVTALGRVRAYGVVLENDGPGVVWDTLSTQGAFTHRMLAQDQAHFARQLAHRNPDLVVLNFGGNDLRRVTAGGGAERLEEETHQLLARVRAGAPNASCLLMGINDHARSGVGEVQPRHVDAVLDAQRRAAARAGCAFWDQTAAMGGAGSFSTWLRRGLASSDGKHLSPRGREVLASRLFAAIEHARASAR